MNIGEKMLAVGIVLYVVSLLVPWSYVSIDLVELTAHQVVNPLWAILAVSTMALLCSSVTIIVVEIQKEKRMM